MELELPLLAESGLGSLDVCACGAVIEGAGVEVAGGVSLVIWGTCCEAASVAVGDVEAQPAIRRATKQINEIRVAFEMGNCKSKSLSVSQA